MVNIYDDLNEKINGLKKQLNNPQSNYLNEEMLQKTHVFQKILNQLHFTEEQRKQVEHNVDLFMQTLMNNFLNQMSSIETLLDTSKDPKPLTFEDFVHTVLKGVLDNKEIDHICEKQQNTENEPQ